MAAMTTPPATKLSKKFLRDGDTPGPAASAISGITVAAVRASAVKPATEKTSSSFFFFFCFFPSCADDAVTTRLLFFETMSLDNLLGVEREGACANLAWWALMGSVRERDAVAQAILLRKVQRPEWDLK